MRPTTLWLPLALAACDPAPAVDTGTAIATRPTPPTSDATPTTETLPPEPTVYFADVAVREPDSARVYVARRLDVVTNIPTRVDITLTAPDGSVRSIAWPDLATEHHLPLVGGLPDTTYDIRVLARGESGGYVATAPFSFTTGGLPPLMPNLAWLARDPTRVQAGWTLLPPWAPEITDLLLVLDGEGRVVWAYDPADDWKAMTPTGAGTLIGVERAAIVEVDWLGETRRRYSVSGGSATTLVDWGDPHHEVVPLADGSVWTWISETRPVDAYPVDYDRLSTAPADIADQVALHFGPDGATLERVSMADLLDPTRIGWNSFDLSSLAVYDWGHANAIQVLPDEDDLLVSLRHQDCVVKLDRRTGAIDWIFGTHDGWNDPWRSALLTPVGAPFAWPGHQHAPVWDGQRLIVFDNGNEGRTTPYSDANRTDTYTRIAAFDIDPVARTAALAWEWSETTTGPLYSRALGNADPLPNGNMLATFSYLYQEGGVVNLDRGRGEKSTRIIEFDPATGETIADLSLWGDVTATPLGWQVDRATRVTTLYGTSATDSADPAE